MMKFKIALAFSTLASWGLAAAQTGVTTSAGASINASVGADTTLNGSLSGNVATGPAGGPQRSVQGSTTSRAALRSATDAFLSAAQAEQELKNLSTSGFAQLDADGNASISQEEATRMAVVAESLATFDGDADGALNTAEFDALTADLRQQLRARKRAAADVATDASAQSRSAFKVLDKNRDGVLVDHEAALSSHTLMHFESIDGNDDGLLSEAEFAAFVDGRTHAEVANSKQ